MNAKIDSEEFKILLDRLDESVGNLNKFIDTIGETDISGTKTVHITKLRLLAKDVSNNALDLSKIKIKK